MLQGSFGLKIIGIGVATMMLAACDTTSDKRTTRAPADETRDMSVDAAPRDRVDVAPTRVGPQPGTQADLDEAAGDRVLFGFDRYDLSPDAQSILRAQAEWLRRYPSVRVIIEGHCDERGTREYNLALGERRANSIKNYLVALGIRADRLQTVSYGKERPSVLGSNPEAWAANRRGVMVVQ